MLIMMVIRWFWIPIGMLRTFFLMMMMVVWLIIVMVIMMSMVFATLHSLIRLCRLALLLALISQLLIRLHQMSQLLFSFFESLFLLLRFLDRVRHFDLFLLLFLLCSLIVLFPRIERHQLFHVNRMILISPDCSTTVATIIGITKSKGFDVWDKLELGMLIPATLITGLSLIETVLRTMVVSGLGSDVAQERETQGRMRKESKNTRGNLIIKAS